MEALPEELLCCILRSASAATLGHLCCASKRLRRATSIGEAWRGATEAAFSSSDVQKALAACSNRWKIAFRFLTLRAAQQAHWKLTKSRVSKEGKSETAKRTVSQASGFVERLNASVRQMRPELVLGRQVTSPADRAQMFAIFERQLAASRAALTAAEQELQECESKATAARLDEAGARARVVSLREGLPRRLQDPATTIDGPSTPGVGSCSSQS